MLTSKELNALQGLLHYLNEDLGAGLTVEDITVMAEDSKPVAVVGYAGEDACQYVLKQITQQRGEVRRVRAGETPCVELHLEPNQEIVSFECKCDTLIYSNRVTNDWRLKAWVATRL